MAQAQLPVVPQGAGGEAREVVRHFAIEPELGVSPEGGLDRRHQDGLVIQAADPAAIGDGDDVVGEAGQSFDHGVSAASAVRKARRRRASHDLGQFPPPSIEPWSGEG